MLKQFKMFNVADIKPHNNKVYDPEVATKEGFMYLGTLSPELQCFGTLLDQQKKLLKDEVRALMDRQREMKESQSVTLAQRVNFINKELPDRSEKIIQLKIEASLMDTIFLHEMISEMNFEPTEVIPSKLKWLVFSGWEVAVRPVTEEDEMVTESESPEEHHEEKEHRGYIH